MTATVVYSFADARLLVYFHLPIGPKVTPLSNSWGHVSIKSRASRNTTNDEVCSTMLHLGTTMAVSSLLIRRNPSIITARLRRPVRSDPASLVQ